MSLSTHHPTTTGGSDMYGKEVGSYPSYQVPATLMPYVWPCAETMAAPAMAALAALRAKEDILGRCGTVKPRFVGATVQMQTSL